MKKKAEKEKDTKTYSLKEEDTETDSSEVAAVKKTKKKSGYNIFVGAKITDLKAKGVKPKERMGQAVALWKQLPDTEKSVWKAKAEKINGQVETHGETQ